MQALPIKDILKFDVSGTVKVNDKDLTLEQVKQLYAGAKSLENNWTYRLIKEQIAYEAIKMGIHSSVTLDMVIFSKAALWVQQQELKLITELSGQEEEIV